MYRPFQRKVVPVCSEERLRQEAETFANHLEIGDRVFLEGDLGAGKSTFARMLFEAFGSEQEPEGSPTFAIAHEYELEEGDLIHVDFYRIESEADLEHAGLPEYFWERDTIVISEWISNWPDFQREVIAVGGEGEFWHVHLKIIDEKTRRLEMTLI